MFLEIQGGDYTINVNLISEVDWTVGDEECTVTMVSGNEFTVEGDDFYRLREKLGME